MKKAFTKDNTKHESWNVLTEQQGVGDVLTVSQNRPQLVYKHSHTCSICHVAKEEIEENFDAISEKADLHFVNVIKSRPVSNAFAEELGVRHESPQVLIIHNGQCIWHKSHWGIKSDAILEALDSVKTVSE